MIAAPRVPPQYKNVRPDYLNAIWGVINFGDVAKRLVRAREQRKGREVRPRVAAASPVVCALPARSPLTRRLPRPRLYPPAQAAAKA